MVFGDREGGTTVSLVIIVASSGAAFVPVGPTRCAGPAKGIVPPCGNVDAPLNWPVWTFGRSASVCAPLRVIIFSPRPYF